jgi:hypothetical protein
MRILRILKSVKKLNPPPWLSPRVRAFDDTCRKSGDPRANKIPNSRPARKPIDVESLFAIRKPSQQFHIPYTEDRVIMMRQMIMDNPEVARLFQLFRLRPAKE